MNKCIYNLSQNNTKQQQTYSFAFPWNFLLNDLQMHFVVMCIYGMRSKENSSECVYFFNSPNSFLFSGIEEFHRGT